ncbi:hypothetical protein DIPPA_33329 [Diplonema papillatum]|nr:hypothetical protein DIPPA_33329 [Diplonema papillatum]
MAMPLYDSNMCPTCFYDLGTFKYCCDSGKPHQPVLCPDCKCDLVSISKPPSKFCTVNGKLHKDSKGREVAQSELEADTCAFCGYAKESHKYCTETGWIHAELPTKYAQHKRKLGQKAAATANGLPTPTAKRIKLSTTPSVAPTAPTTPTTPTANGSSGAQYVPTPSPPPAAKTGVVKPSVVPREVYSDGSFLMSGITPSMRILFIGEGNFSFSRTIGKRVFADRSWRNIVATDLELLAGQNTPGHQFTLQNTVDLLKHGATVSIGVDATCVQQCLPHLQAGTFDLITFQFPHNADKNFPFYPFPKGVPLESVGTHREMLSAFLKQAQIMLKDGGRACITTKTSEPYKSWEVDMLAEPPMWYAQLHVN